VFLALLLGQKPSNIEQRLREWCYDVKSKQGKKRRSLDVTTTGISRLGEKTCNLHSAQALL